MTHANTPVRKVLHVLGDKSWRPQFKYLGSTKDIVGRRDYFASRGIQCVEMQVKGRHDHICLEMLQQMDLAGELAGIDAVVMEHPRYPRAMRWLGENHPRIRLMIRGHNAEAIHQLHTAYAFMASGLSGFRWRWKRARVALNNLWDRFRFDLVCGHRADYILAIADWEVEHYWPLMTRRDKVLGVPYFVPESYEFTAPPELAKVTRCLCAMSADWTPLAHHAAKVMVELLMQTTPEQTKGWKFSITGDLGKHRDSYKPLKQSGRVDITGNVDNPFEYMYRSRAMAHLSNLGMGFKTKLLDFVSCGGWLIVQKKLYDRQPKELQPFCLVVDPLTPESFLEALKKAKEPWPDNSRVNDDLRERAFATLDIAFGHSGPAAVPAPALVPEAEARAPATVG